ncbi:MAG: FAD-dependent oxidoreductase [Clostridiales Family XIII bacterium]|jgi:NADPH-dependent glutamate synthase beta subunit-like oxidoreductase|nr:FAD-dependent oxidoreductase [Clostridiales Family XIII bacterium]
MKRYAISRNNESRAIIDRIYSDLVRRVISNPSDICQVAVASNFLKQSRSQSCGKCTPCRIGLIKLEKKIDRILDGEGGEALIEELKNIATNIKISADCAIGIASADMVLRGIGVFYDDYLSHANGNGCTSKRITVPCISRCPAGVQIPHYITLLKHKRYDEAVRLIRQDNPLVSVCGLICEHPCEDRCRRNMIDDSINIRGLKRFITEHAFNEIREENAPATGKKIAIIGGGPSGLTCAYYLAVMGHDVTIIERLEHLGGMLRYGIPKYRLPREVLDSEIEFILGSGIHVIYNTSLGIDTTLDELKEEYDCIYLSIGAHGSKTIGIEGEELNGVYSAVELLREIGDEHMPNFTGKKVAVIGGGNVAMDVARTSLRLGADGVTIVYRRRRQDMTAQAIEIESTIAEGGELLTLHSPIRAAGDENGNVTGLVIRKQIASALDQTGKPRVHAIEAAEEQTLGVDIIISAIGQSVEEKHEAIYDNNYDHESGFVVSGGDYVSGPATVILAVAAAKQAAHVIDKELGFAHAIPREIVIPDPVPDDLIACARVDMVERKPSQIISNFTEIEVGMCEEEAMQEASRCLRCDKNGFGELKGGLIW